MDCEAIRQGRRPFLTTCTSAGVLALCSAKASARRSSEKPAPMLDIHVHLFGTGDAGTGCRLSKKITNGLLYRGMVELLRLRGRAKTTDESYRQALLEHVQGSPVSRVALVAQDAVYDRHGKPDWDRTPFYTPNDYAFAVCRDAAHQLSPCVSINPNRRDALEELDRCVAKGARIVKIHPPTQGVDLADRRHRSFFAQCADRSVVVMVHTGHEHAAPIIDKTLADPRKLELALSEGCTVVASHCGTGSPGDTPDMLPSFLAMIRKYDRLWGDTSVLGIATRARDFLMILDDDESVPRLVHGSDFPFPAMPAAFIERIGFQAAMRLQRQNNLLRRDFDLKQALGVGRASAERGYRLLFGGK